MSKRKRSIEGGVRTVVRRFKVTAVLAEPVLPEEPWEAPKVARKVVRRVTEAKLQKQCIDWVRGRGWWARKFQSMGQKSVPDYLLSRGFGIVLPIKGVKLAVEFKKLGEVSSQNQWDEQYLMWLAGWDVHECDNFEKFKRIILEIELRFDSTMWLD